MKFAAGYVRCSTDMQDGSIEQQKKAIEAWANDNGFKVIEWFEDEGISGTDFKNRLGFMRMADRAKYSPNFEYILVYDESRWGRPGNPRLSLYWKTYFDMQGVKIRVINSQSKNENDLPSILLEILEGSEASEYSKKLSRATTRGCLDNASKGFSNGGTPPYGYKRLAISKETGEVVRELNPGEWSRDSQEKVVWGLGDDAEVQIVKRIFELKVSGYGYRTIANSLNQDKIPCPRRGRWRNKNQQWAMGTIQSIVTNPSYCGDRVYNRHPLSKKRINEENVLGEVKSRWISNEKEWKVLKNAHPAIISREVFDRANPVTKHINRVNQYTYDSPYLLTGLVRCTRCGFNYQGQSYRKQDKYYYVDGGNMNKGDSVCGRMSIGKDKLENFVLEHVRSSLNKSRVAKRFREMICEFINGRSSNDVSLSLIDSRIRENEQKIENIMTLVEQGISMDTAFGRIKALEKVKSDLYLERRKMENAHRISFNLQEAIESGERFLSDFDHKFESAEIQERKQLIRQVVLGIDVDPGARTATCIVTKIPMVNQALRTLIKPLELFKSQHLVGAHCSGGRT